MLSAVASNFRKCGNILWFDLWFTTLEIKFSFFSYIQKAKTAKSLLLLWLFCCFCFFYLFLLRFYPLKVYVFAWIMTQNIEIKCLCWWKLMLRTKKNSYLSFGVGFYLKRCAKSPIMLAKSEYIESFYFLFWALFSLGSFKLLSPFNQKRLRFYITRDHDLHIFWLKLQINIQQGSYESSL